MKCEFGLCAFEETDACKIVDSCKSCAYGKLVFKGIPLQVIKNSKSSQVCQVCNTSVNWKYCSNCGQRLKY